MSWDDDRAWVDELCSLWIAGGYEKGTEHYPALVDLLVKHTGDILTALQEYKKANDALERLDSLSDKIHKEVWAIQRKLPHE